jgi:hypothetical protein
VVAKCFKWEYDGRDHIKKASAVYNGIRWSEACNNRAPQITGEKYFTTDGQLLRDLERLSWHNKWPKTTYTDHLREWQTSTDDDNLLAIAGYWRRVLIDAWTLSIRGREFYFMDVVYLPCWMEHTTSYWMAFDRLMYSIVALAAQRSRKRKTKTPVIGAHKLEELEVGDMAFQVKRCRADRCAIPLASESEGDTQAWDAYVYNGSGVRLQHGQWQSMVIKCRSAALLVELINILFSQKSI